MTLYYARKAKRRDLYTISVDGAAYHSLMDALSLIEGRCDGCDPECTSCAAFVELRYDIHDAIEKSIAANKQK